MFTSRVGQDPWLSGIQTPQQHLERQGLLLAFARALRLGIEPAARVFSGSTIERTIREICLAMVRQGFQDPRKQHPSQERLDKPVADMMVQARRADPAPVQQVALPSSIVRLAVQKGREGDEAMSHATSDLITLAFFFLLRVGEYTESAGDRLTVPLRLQDVTLWQGNRSIPHSSNDAEIALATGVTLKLANQKNGIKDAVMYHDSSGDPVFDPVGAACRIVCRLRGHPRSSGIGTYVDSEGLTKRVSPALIREVLKGATAASTLLGENINPRLVGTHSLRSGGGPCASN